MEKGKRGAKDRRRNGGPGPAGPQCRLAEARPSLSPRGGSLRGNALRRFGNSLAPGLAGRICSIEFLHLIQDRYHYLSARHLRALCDEMRLAAGSSLRSRNLLFPFRRGERGRHSSATDHHSGLRFDHLRAKGAEALLAALEARANPSAVRVLGPRAWAAATPRRSARWAIYHVDHATVESVEAVVESGKREPDIPAYQNLAEYRAAGGYSVLESCRSGARTWMRSSPNYPMEG